MNIDVTGIDFDYISLPVIGIAGGGAVVAWHRDLWNASLRVLVLYHRQTGTARRHG